MNRDFKGIWIPKEIWLNENLTIQEKIFFVEIDSLDNDDGCFAGNAHFAEFFGISKTRVSLVIKSLVEKEFIKSTIVYKEGTKEILKRVLNVCYRPYTTKVNEPPQQILKTPPQQKLKDNNTVISNTVNNTINNTKKNISAFDSALNDFYDMRKKIKAPMTDRAKKLLSNKLDELALDDENKKIKILEQSIVNSWKSVFPLKQKYEQQSFLDESTTVKINGGSFKIG